MTETQRFALADVNAGDAFRDDIAHTCEQRILARPVQRPLKFRVDVEVVLDGPLGTAGDEHQLGRTGRNRFLHRVLDQWLIYDRQHLLGARFSGR